MNVFECPICGKGVSLMLREKVRFEYRCSGCGAGWYVRVEVTFVAGWTHAQTKAPALAHVMGLFHGVKGGQQCPE